jgi:antitoxin component of RelBE/YafQ-DinJ toxin-antitoxin module
MATSTKNERLYLRINSDLKKRIDKYAKAHGITLSQAVTRFFTHLLAQEKNKTRD